MPWFAYICTNMTAIFCLGQKIPGLFSDSSLHICLVIYLYYDHQTIQNYTEHHYGQMIHQKSMIVFEFY